jgi:type II secretion system protein N
MKRRALYLACGIPVGIVFFLLLTIWFVPNRTIRGVLERTAENAGYTLTFTGFRKGFPLGVKADTVEVATAKGVLIKATDVKVGVEILPLFAGRVRVAYRAGLGGGTAEGEIALGKKQGWSLRARKVGLDAIPFFTSVAGARVKGELRADGEVTSEKGVPAGELQLEVRGAELGGVKIGEMPLPDASYRQVRGALHIGQGKAQIKSFTLDGDGIYVRLKGDTTIMKPLGDSPLNLTLEMMPKPEFLERQKFVFLLLLKYQTSPGAYSIPVHGTLAHPSI